MNSNIFICSICQMETINFYMFVQHMSIHFNQSNLDPFKKRDHLNQSINEFNNYKLLCNICNHLLNFNQFIDLLIHLQNKHMITDYHCNGCEETFTDQVQCLIHILYHHITTTKSTIQDDNDDTTISLNTSSSRSNSSSHSNTITNHDHNTKKSTSFNENENIPCKYQYLNSTHDNDMKLHNISTNSDHIYTNNHLLLNRQENVKLNQTTTNNNYPIINKSSINTLDINYPYHIQSFIHFLTMLCWPNLWSINWIQSNIDGILNKHLNNDLNQDQMNMISNMDEYTRPFTSSSSSASSSSLSIPSLSSLHFQENYETHGLTPKRLIDTIISDEMKSNEINEPIMSKDLNPLNDQCTTFQSTSNCIVLLTHSHPVLGLLPYEIASKMDSYKASKICHVCLKEFTDEMTVLHHQVEEHSLEDDSNVSNSINEPNSLLIR
ncbi:unnamed protein product [Schistosoma mattheei]|uniref:C2H2-type domain-containing protein n=2 Tax=Schistosoma mattheei TaxID=31246 RepID=A0AA85AYK0_9TREM|nr:unnamed protein product [Schistosoma mattheei]